MSRLPIRVRLTLAFTLAMALVLVATGAFLYFRLQSSLDEAIDEALLSELERADAEVSRAGFLQQPPWEGFAQLLLSDGRVLTTSGLPDERQAVGPTVVARAAEGERQWVEIDGLSFFDAPVRVVASSTTDGRGVIVLAASLDDRNEALSGLLVELLIVAPVALLVTALLGYGLARAALRPVEALRVDAEAVSDPVRRLPLPRAHDEIHRLGETLNAMLGRLEAGLERERSFVADASHELRTPLALLQAELELARRRPRTRGELEQALASASEETDRLVRLAEDLLVLARSDQGRLGVRREPVPVAGLLGDVAGRFGERVHVEAAPNGLTVIGDCVRLEQALGSLVDNALRHGGGATLSAEAAAGAVELHVRDEGPGFPEEFLPHAFERFSRPDEARSGGGAGLGLALAQAIAEAHGGSAGAANRGARGADVWLSLPA